MFNNDDLKLFKEKGLFQEVIEEQLENFRKGFPWLQIVRPATIGDGIMDISENEAEEWIEKYVEKSAGLGIIKFIPASGAASRMFKSLFEFESSSLEPQKETSEIINHYPDIKKITENIKSFAFADELNDRLINDKLSIDLLLNEDRIYDLISYILFEKGLSYGSLPKGLIQFHAYPDGPRTAMEEHFVEGALYGKDSRNIVSLHFTVSPEHHELFLDLVNQIKDRYEEKYGVNYSISFSFQKPSTDTIAVDLNNEPLRNEEGELVFRPGGHGALLENLNDLDTDIVFIKNIDNVAPDRLKKPTVKYKKILGGILLDLQEKIFSFLSQLDDKNQLTEDKRLEIKTFIETELSIEANISSFSREEEIQYFRKKLNRPIRICGMVKNTGEPGGGPFITINTDGSASPQVVETSQMDMSKEENIVFLKKASHFNPVDLVCSLKNYEGRKFDLMNYRDMNTGFISLKSKDGIELKALELPGLWNGAMSDWNTIFVEVPIETFSPVKTINDLLRREHQS